VPRRARIALLAAGAGIALLVLVYWVAHALPLGRRADLAVLAGFAELGRPGLDAITGPIARLCNPSHYIVLAAIPILIALLRRRVRVAVVLGIVLLGANATTELLKPLLAAPRGELSVVWVAPASWPSGHATAAMTLALCMVIAVPAGWRGRVAAAMAAFAVAVSYSFLELGWHYPSDVLGGFLVASVWALLAVAALSLDAARRRETVSSPGSGAAGGTAQTLRPVAGLGLGAAAGLGLLIGLSPHAALGYAGAHPAFVLGAATIATLGVLLAGGLSLVLRRA
jgi:membrane-associated phospholipid phosphatase